MPRAFSKSVLSCLSSTRRCWAVRVAESPSEESRVDGFRGSYLTVHNYGVYGIYATGSGFDRQDRGTLRRSRPLLDRAPGARASTRGNCADDARGFDSDWTFGGNTRAVGKFGSPRA